MRILVLLFISIFTSSLACADIWSALSEGSAKLWGAGDCGTETNKESLSAMQKSHDCLLNTKSLSEPQSDIQDLQTHLISDSENGFFAALALQHSKELRCSTDFARQLATSSQEGRTDIQKKMKILREAKQRLVKASEELARNPSASPKVCPLSLLDLAPSQGLVEMVGKDLGYDLCKEIIVSRTAFESISRSIPLSGAPSVQSLLERYANLPEGAELEKMNSQLDPLTSKAYSDAAAVLEKSGNEMGQLGLSSGAEIGRGTRYALMSDPRVVSKVIASAGPENQGAMNGIACRADQRFYSGADALDRNIMIGSFVITGGAGVALRVGSGAARIAAGANSARSAGMLSLNAARTLEYSALGLSAGLDAAAAYSQIDKTCFANGPAALAEGAAGASQCVSAPTIQQLSQDGCVLAISLSALGFTSLVVPALAKGGRAAPLKTNAAETAMAEVRTGNASSVLGRPLSAEQNAAVLQAHSVGKGQVGKDGSVAGIGNYTSTQLREKDRILKNAGFSDAEIRNLMENGVVGQSIGTQGLRETILPQAWTPKAQAEFEQALVRARLANDVGRRRFNPEVASSASVREIEDALHAQMGMRGASRVPTVTYSEGKVIMTYDGMLGKKYRVNLNASNGQYYYTITESANGAAPVYLKLTPKRGGGWQGLTNCGNDMEACHYAATGF